MRSLFILLPLVIGCAKGKPESDVIAQLDTKVKTHVKGDLGKGNVPGLFVVSIKWRFLSCRQHPSSGSISVKGVCQITWRNDRLNQTKARYHLSLEDAFGFRIKIVSNNRVTLVGKREQTRQIDFTTTFNTVKEANLVRRVKVYYFSIERESWQP